MKVGEDLDWFRERVKKMIGIGVTRLLGNILGWGRKLFVTSLRGSFKILHNRICQ